MIASSLNADTTDAEDEPGVPGSGMKALKGDETGEAVNDVLEYNSVTMRNFPSRFLPQQRPAYYDTMTHT